MLCAFTLLAAIPYVINQNTTTAGVSDISCSSLTNLATGNSAVIAARRSYIDANSLHVLVSGTDRSRLTNVGQCQLIGEQNVLNTVVDSAVLGNNMQLSNINTCVVLGRKIGVPVWTNFPSTVIYGLADKTNAVFVGYSNNFLSFDNNGITASAPIAVPQAQFNFDFPLAGTVRHYATHWPSLLKSTVTSNIVFQASGRGVVRQIQFVFSLQGATDWAPLETYNYESVWVRIEYDGEASPSTSFRISDALCWQYVDHLTNTARATYETPFWVVMDTPYDLANPTPWRNSGFTLAYPIPYTNGIKIWLEAVEIDPGIGQEITADYYYSADVMYSDNVLAERITDLRFRSAQSSNVVAGVTAGAGTVELSGTNVIGTSTAFDATYIGKCISLPLADSGADSYISSVANATHMGVISADARTVSAGKAYYIHPTVDWFTRPAGKEGYVAVVTAGIAPYLHTNDINDMVYYEANTRFFIDQELEPSFEWTSTEEFFTGDFYFLKNKPINRFGGVINIAPGNPIIAPGDEPNFYATTQYRTFKDSPVHYTNGCRFMEPGYNYPGSSNVFQYAVFYYEYP